MAILELENNAQWPGTKLVLQCIIIIIIIVNVHNIYIYRKRKLITNCSFCHTNHGDKILKAKPVLCIIISICSFLN